MSDSDIDTNVKNDASLVDISDDSISNIINGKEKKQEKRKLKLPKLKHRVTTRTIHSGSKNDKK